MCIRDSFLSGQEADAALFDQTAIIDTDIWKALFDFQKDGAKGAIHKINQHNGCILADSVGLGKTYSALAVIKYHELRNHRVLVLCPKKLRDNWTVYLAQNNSELNPFLKDRFAYTVLSHTDLSRDSGRVDGIDVYKRQMQHFALIHQVFDRAGNLFDWHRRIHAVLIKQVDAIGAQALERAFDRALDVLRAAIEAGAAFAGVRVDVPAEFGGDAHLVPKRRDGFAKDAFVFERAVGFGGIEKGHALRMCGPNEGCLLYTSRCV